MGLDKYNKKRDFTKTTEPKAGKSTSKKLAFVIQRHHASHLHYDFRLELDGVLKSWAIPKGPSMNSKDKRLAIMVEDHPYDYKDFEGLIPQGEYGGGVVIIWDQGYYESLSVDRADDIMTLHKGLKEGNLKFRLFGERVKGEFALVKLKNDNSDNNNSWLLIKHKDDFAANEKYDSELFVPNEIKVLKNNKDNEVKTLPNLKIITKKNVKVESKNVESLPELAEFKPMMAKNGASIVINDADKIYEKKLDGYRAISITGKNANLISRNSIDFSIKFPQILSNLLLIDKIIILDGEIVIENKKGKSDFQALQIYNGDTKDYQLVYYVFDILFIDHHDLRNLGLIKRKNLLSVLFESFSKTGKIKLLEFYDDGENLFENAKKESWEGIISKDINSKYLSNKRSDAWLKHKLTLSQETIICGFTMPAGSRKHIGSLILGISVAGKIKYIGNCGTGFDEKSLSDLFNTLEPLITKTPSLNEKIAHKTSIIWVKPKLVCEVVYAEMTKEGRMRHPVFKGLRLDKSTIDLDIELQNVTTNEDNDKLMKIGTKSLKLTNLNKIFWEVENITKGQLLNYYDIMSEHIIPYIKDKPLSMKRQPGGIDDEGFFQKDVDVEKIPKWIKTHNVYSESNDKTINYIVGSDKASLLYMVNLGCIEINPWLSDYKMPDKPKYMVIDLDPHDVAFTDTIIVALGAKELFDLIGIPVFIKTSGSKGLHIYSYLASQYNYDIAVEFAKYFVTILQKKFPKTTSIERSPAKRPKKIYLDFLQNRMGQTIASPYSVRPKTGATVSTPLNWDEVNDSLKISNFTLLNVPDRVKKIDNPWANLHKRKVNMIKALDKLKSIELKGNY